MSSAVCVGIRIVTRLGSWDIRLKKNLKPALQFLLPKAQVPNYGVRGLLGMRKHCGAFMASTALPSDAHARMGKQLVAAGGPRKSEVTVLLYLFRRLSAISAAGKELLLHQESREHRLQLRILELHCLQTTWLSLMGPLQPRLILPPPKVPP